ncbi:hypothetical protein LTR91_002545 [Friedmanniomyces endolithicus]|uniref:Uncharacterized protein n=1 Tax=Friedmanniomyces endolithicus TaxID=329885 RepID=A0AAN6KZG0_9PEZI|nr:hypothetical protein LTR35_004664 [Friedmanniomyces endolithicus]KAK0299130.1 hypothetical protein LTS00_002240 [Friedmanniomyces endolithicus]KAK0322770.1 hypothetical protein LTR82_006227 [Friedmanniomyces endolithicus]KAK0920503.1 hypothetical protein LTR57_009759 [Friedmanniomyces endolithicus]KAK0992751.1 hypothetical protein LTS01_007716 [Friedmanniomyces endolithicus]
MSIQRDRTERRCRARILMPSPDRPLIDRSARSEGTIELGRRYLDPRDNTVDLVEQRQNVIRPPSSSQSSERTLAPSLARTISDQSQSRYTYARPGQRDQSKNDKVKKKKGSGVLGFLTLKEPSGSAWEEYAKAQKKASAEKDSRRSNAERSGVSSRQLPDFVPATNSKWDGLPDSAKRVSMQSRSRSQRMSSLSGSTSQASRSVWSSVSERSGERSPARRYGSVSSKPSRPESAPVPLLKLESLQSRASSRVPRNVAPQLPVLTGVHPALRNNAVTPWDKPRQHDMIPAWETQPQRSPETFLHPPSPISGVSELPCPTPTLELELPKALGLDGHATSPEPSPRTPPADFEEDPTDNLAEQYQYVRLGDQLAQSADHGGTFWHSDTDNELEAAKTPRYHALSTPVKPSSLRSEHSASEQDLPIQPTIDEVEDEEDDVFLPTLRDGNGHTSPFIFEQFSVHERSFFSHSHASPVSRPARTVSPPSRLRPVTTSTASTAEAPLPSLNASTEPEGPTMLSTAASTTSEATSNRRTSLSPVRSNSDAASVAPSEMSARWKLSPKERLGLGGRMTRRSRADQMPWDNDGASGTPPTVKRLSGAQAALDGSIKLKRLSMRLGRKL